MKEGIAETLKFDVSNETIKTMAAIMGNFLACKACPQNKKEELLQQMRDIATLILKTVG